MTLNQFLKEMKNIGNFGILMQFGKEMIRHNKIKDSLGFQACPICAVANKKSKSRRYTNNNYRLAAKYLGLNNQDAEMIVHTADEVTEISKKYSEQLRNNLMTVVK